MMQLSTFFLSLIVFAVIFHELSLLLFLQVALLLLFYNLSLLLFFLNYFWCYYPQMELFSYFSWIVFAIVF